MSLCDSGSELQKDEGGVEGLLDLVWELPLKRCKGRRAQWGKY